MTIDRDLFGQPIPEKKRGRRRPTEPSARQIPLPTPVVPGLGDLVARLRPIHRRLEGDLRQRLDRDADLQKEVARQCEAISRDLGVALAQTQYVHTAATVYVLKALFLRVAEDYGLFPAPARKIALRGDLYRELCGLAPRLTWADYLEYAVRDLAYLPVAYDLFKETGYELIPPGDEAARALLDAVGNLPDLRVMDTRALGDLYEHLMDPEERKRLAYYPTPDFIIDFLLDRTLEPAIEEFGIYDLRYLDPCCGTGHFGVRAYRRLDRHLAVVDPDLTHLERFEQIVENNLFAVDVSEFATRITLFRLFLEGVRLAKSERRDVAAWGSDITFNVYTANSLIKLPSQPNMPLFADNQPPRRERDPKARFYGRELTHLRVELHDALTRGFHVVNANPPYVRIQKQGSEVVAPVNGNWDVVDFVQYLRDNYETARGNFDLSVPFAERGLELLVPGGYLGYITSGKFAKQAYGRRIASLLAGGGYHLLFVADLTDARVFEAGTYPALVVLQRPFEGARVPSDAPTEVLATHQPAAGGGEEDWRLLQRLLQHPGDVFEPFAGHYAELQGHFRSHPWTFRRGRQDLLARIHAASGRILSDYARIGVDFMSNADPVFCDYVTESFIRRQRLERSICLPCLRGENVRDWGYVWHGNRKREQTYVLATGVGAIKDIEQYPGVAQFLRRYRAYLEARRIYGDSLMKIRNWYEFWWWGAKTDAPKLIWPEVATHNHFFAWYTDHLLARHSCETAYLECDVDELDLQLLVSFLNSAAFAYAVKTTSGKLSGATEEKARFRWRKEILESAPVPRLDLLRGCSRLRSAAHEMAELSTRLKLLSTYFQIRERPYASATELQTSLRALDEEAVAIHAEMRNVQAEIDQGTYDALGLTPDDAAILQHPTFRRAWGFAAPTTNTAFQILDFVCDLAEDLFASQRPPQEQPLTPAQIVSALAQNPKFEPLRAVYYGGRPVSGEEFTRVCLDWDCRPIPFDEEEVLVGRRPKRVDVLHERFFRFDGVDRNLYGWTGWSAEAQANVFLTLAERAADKMPFYRWVARLIDLPEESPDIEDPDLRAQLRRLIGDARLYPYVVME